MNQAFDITADQYVWFGGYPGAGRLIADEERWKKYVSDALIETSISKDILMLTRVDKPALLEKKGKVIGLKVKSGVTQKAPGMAAFKKLHEPDKILLVGNSGIPWQEFLKVSPGQLF